MSRFLHVLPAIAVALCGSVKIVCAAPGHVIEIDRPVLAVEDGPLLGNGDLSVSVYQKADQIVWRFGKGDVWDRRHDTSDDPKPLHIDELAHGIAVEGWKAEFNQSIKPLHGTTNPQRVKEVSVDPPSYRRRPYPCPKPVGELSLQFPKNTDLTKVRMSQRLLIEEGRLEITCVLPDARRIVIESFVTPRQNNLVVRWQTRNCPVQFSLYRWADPPYGEFAARRAATTQSRVYVELYGDAKVTPLPPPAVRRFEGLELIEQRFFPDPLFPDGFRYWCVPLAVQCRIEAASASASKDARLTITPTAGQSGGWLAVAVPTSNDPGGVEAECRRTVAELAGDRAAAMARWRDQQIGESRKFWSKSSVTVADPLLERLWYEIFHLRRCIYRRDAVPPGLYLPSALGDYCVWHGDYHTNFNIQAPFFGNYEANHLEIGDAYFGMMDFMLDIGRKVAHDYYNARGSCIALSGFPIRAKEDTFGLGNFSRMAYMTGWMMQPYWLRYLYTGDKNWLRAKGYPAIPDCALFYTDFLKKRADGLYHAFPSAEEERPFTGDPATYTDRPQVLQHVRYCLRAAILASTELGIDRASRAEWQDRLDHLAADPEAYFGNRSDSLLQGLDRWCDQCSPPQWGRGKPFRLSPSKSTLPPGALKERFGAWWLCHPGGAISALRSGDFAPESDCNFLREYLKKYRRCNGLVGELCPMGHELVFNEELAIVAALQEMMLQSWDGALRVFPAWPKNLDARFENFRAEGAFLVTAAWSQGQVTSLLVHSENGTPCTLYSPWPKGIRVTDATGNEVATTSDPYGRPTFPTRPTVEYRLQSR
jgi:hypothetical protein